MDIQHLDILLRLIIAHLLADFVFQTDKINEEKKNGPKSKYFWLHLAIVGGLVYIFLIEWANWQLPITVIIAHGLIDWGKSSIKKDGVWIYIIDQLLHILSLVLLWSFFKGISLDSIPNHISTLLNDTSKLIIFTFYLIATLPLGYLIGHLTKNWQETIADDQQGLPNAGKTIGIIERILILTFIINLQWQAIGFLMAAKSVFRFGDLKDRQDRKKTEYILVGTLLSFTFSIMLGILMNQLLK